MTRREFSAIAALSSLSTASSARGGRVVASTHRNDPRLRASFRRPVQKGWIVVRLAGSPTEIGYQHGSLLAAEISATHKAVALGLVHDGKPYSFYRDAAQNIFWPRVPAEYRQELGGMAEALRDAGLDLDLWDLVFLNASLELPYYVNSLNDGPRLPIPERCSAFLATGSFTKDGRIVAGHNCWSDYLSGAYWNILFDINPQNGGHRFFMDGLPGLIHSGDDFGITESGLIITETTISNFRGFDPQGIPEFVRARRAMQYAASIDDFVAIMKEGNNGGYANTWLVADIQTGEIANLELGLRNIELRRTRDGYFAGSNCPANPRLIVEETDFNMRDQYTGPAARRTRWDHLMAAYKGRIDVSAGQRFLADHFDSALLRNQPSERTLCGHIEASVRGARGWTPPFAAAGSVQNKVTDSVLAKSLSLSAAFGHACGTSFHAGAHLRRHPELSWQKAALKDVPSHPWTLFRPVAAEL